MEYTGKTTLITGASAGIGVAYAEGFAARGSNLILVARRKDRLDEVAKTVSQKYGVSVTVIAQDLTAPGAVAKLENALATKKLTVDVLINNAGFGVNGYFIEEDRSRTQEEITLNVSVLVDLTAAFLPGMVQRNSGAVVNIASTASFQPVPGLAVYGATKAFVRSFTEAVWGELHDSKVRVLSVSPGSTESEFFEVAGGTPGGKAMPASAVVETTFAALDKNTPSVVVGTGNSLFSSIVRFIPKKSVIKVAGGMFLPKRKGK
jgi:short-subunit dehydrogenase